MPTATTKRRGTPPPPPEEPAAPFEQASPLDGIGEDFPESPKRDRSAKMRKLEESIAGFYIMLGGGLSTLPPQFVGARVKVIGLGFAAQSEQIANAWVDLCEEDKRVLKMWESLTALSGWSRVFGEHLRVVGETTPGIAAVMPSGGMRQQQGPQTQAPNGANDAQTAMLMAELFRMAQSQERQQQAQREPQFAPAPPPPVQPQPQAQGEPHIQRQGGIVRPGRNAGIPTPADLGVSIPDAPLDFPSSGSENLNK